MSSLPASPFDRLRVDLTRFPGHSIGLDWGLRKGVNMGVKGRRIFSEQFKSDAVKLATGSGKTVRQVARDLKLEPGTLHTWIRERGKRAGDAVAETKTETLEEEVRRLRRDLAAVTDERDFLKKAAAYFAREKP